MCYEIDHRDISDPLLVVDRVAPPSLWEILGYCHDGRRHFTLFSGPVVVFQRSGGLRLEAHSAVQQLDYHGILLLRVFVVVRQEAIQV
jgi:hypothetical protein